MKRFLLVVGLFIVVGANVTPQEKGTQGIVVDKEKKTVTIDAKMAPRKLPHLKGEIYPLEVIACWAHPKGKKAHETVVTIDVKPSDVHKAIESLGVQAGKPVMGDGEPKGPALNVYFLAPDSTGLERKVTLDKAMFDPRNGKAFPKNIEWRFTGSAQAQPDPTKDEKVYGADYSGTLLAIFPVTDQTVLQTELTIKYEGLMKLEVTKALPKEGTPVKLVIEIAKKK